ncbi:MAG: OpgC domain-containing protein [Chloroflexi bacterium]|nr:OpgC domain-containing protein [Chloroflexota bacterium]
MATRARWTRPGLPALPAWARVTWRYQGASGRDARLDLLRGCLIVAMLVDHLGGSSWWYAVTGGNAFYVSAAEGFVFLSGLVMSLVYARVISRDGLCAATKRALRRAGTLYLMAIGLSAAFYGASSLAGASWAEPLVDLPAAILHSATLRRSDYLADVLMLYALLVLVAPLALALLARGRAVPLLLGSAAIWGGHQVGWTAPIDALLGGPETFRPLAWQVIFVAGLVLGWHWRRLEPRVATRGWTLATLALGTVAATLIALAVIAPHTPLAEPVAAIFAKDGLRGGRLLAAAIFFPVLFAIATHLWQPLRAGLGWLLLPLGQRALPAYALHLFVILGAHVWWPRLPGYSLDDAAGNSMLQALAVLLLWALVRLPDAARSLAPALVAGAVRPAAGRPIAAAGALVGVLLAGGGLAVLPVAAPSLVPSRAVSPALPVAPAQHAPAVPTYIAQRIERTATATSASLTNERPVAGSAVARPDTTPSSPLAGAGAASVESHAFYSVALGRTMAYWIYLPPGYRQTSARYPVLYLLHGIGGDRGEWIEYGAVNAAQRRHDAGQAAPMLIVLPEGEQSYWVNHVEGPRWGDYVADDLVAHIDATYRTQPVAAARAIGGLSMGATAALTLALTYPDRFGTVGLHSPSVRAADQALPFLGVDDEFARRDLLTILQTTDAPFPRHVWIDVGADDGWAGTAQALHEALLARGVAHTWQLNTGAHDGNYWSAHVTDYLRYYDEAVAQTTIMASPPGGQSP